MGPTWCSWVSVAQLHCSLSVKDSLAPCCPLCWHVLRSCPLLLISLSSDSDGLTQENNWSCRSVTVYCPFHTPWRARLWGGNTGVWESEERMYGESPIWNRFWEWVGFGWWGRKLGVTQEITLQTWGKGVEAAERAPHQGTKDSGIDGDRSSQCQNNGTGRRME